MLRVDITIASGLPSLQHWLNPNYVGRISEFDFNELGIDVHLPANWLVDFPDNNYKFTALLKLLPPSSNVHLSLEKIGIAAEKMSPYWMDFYALFSECLKTFGAKKAVTKKEATDPKKEPRKPTLTKYMRVTESKVLKTLHLNSDHSTLAALNHFIRTKFTYPWEWLVTAPAPIAGLDIAKKIEDAFDEKITKQTGVFLGIDGDGDFTNMNNIRSLDASVNLFTFDFLTLGGQMNHITTQLVGALICMSKTLVREGNAIFNININAVNTSPMVSILFILASSFKHVELIQLHGLYVYCREFTGISKLHTERLQKILPYLRNIDDPYVPSIFPRDQIPSTLIMKLSMIFSRITSVEWTEESIKKLELAELKPHHRIFKTF